MRALTTALSALPMAERLLVACDFDGVLAPIVAHHDEVDPLVASLAALNSLSAHDTTSVAIVSGRSFTDLVRVAKVTGAIRLVGGHGADCGSPVTTAAIDRLDRAERDLALVLRAPGGAHIERKTTGIALHYRTPEALTRTASAAIERTARREQLYASTGINVIELRLDDVNKGQALVALKEQTQASVAVVIGDDVTDEDAFASAAPGDITIKVGSGETAAQFRVPDPIAVSGVLARLADRRTDTT